MNELGTAILVAMRDQGWLVLTNGESFLTLSPMGSGREVPVALFEDPDESRLRIVLLAWIVVDGLWWPWPPDHIDEIHGETPLTE